jgi:F-type H+-transporting ATPase subunit delta
MPSARSRRYARAAFELAREGGDFEGWQHRLEAVRMVLEQPQVRALLSNPTVPEAERQAAVEALAIEAMGLEGVNLAKLLVASGHVEDIGAIVEEFERLADDALGRVRASARAAVELTAEESASLRSQLAARLGREVRLQLSVDPSLLGGLVVRYGDRVIDASLAARLEQLRRVLVEA